MCFKVSIIFNLWLISPYKSFFFLFQKRLRLEVPGANVRDVSSKQIKLNQLNCNNWLTKNSLNKNMYISANNWFGKSFVRRDNYFEWVDTSWLKIKKTNWNFNKENEFPIKICFLDWNIFWNFRSPYNLRYFGPKKGQWAEKPWHCYTGCVTCNIIFAMF